MGRTRPVGDSGAPEQGEVAGKPATPDRSVEGTPGPEPNTHLTFSGACG